MHGSGAIPLDGFKVVHRHALTVLIHDGDEELSGRVAFVRQRLPFLEGLGLVVLGVGLPAEIREFVVDVAVDRQLDWIAVFRARGKRRYEKKLSIDPKGEMPDGSVFKGASGIRDYLMERPEQFTRCLTEKLLIYALGRRLGFTDRDDIDHIVAAMPDHKYGLRELIHETVATEVFRSK